MADVNGADFGGLDALVYLGIVALFLGTGVILSLPFALFWGAGAVLWGGGIGAAVGAVCLALVRIW